MGYTCNIWDFLRRIGVIKHDHFKTLSKRRMRKEDLGMLSLEACYPISISSRYTTYILNIVPIDNPVEALCRQYL